MSILESIVKTAPARTVPTKTVPAKSILELFGSPQKQRRMEQTNQIGSDLSRLEQLQAKVSYQMVSVAYDDSHVRIDTGPFPG